MRPALLLSSLSVASLPRCGILAVAALVLSCSGSSGASGSRQNLPTYTGEATKLFDDRIDSNSVGLADVATKPRTDAVLRARTQSADGVARVRVSTVTVDISGGKPAYHVNLAITDPLSRRRIGEKSIEIFVGAESPSFGIIKWLDTKLMGHTFIAFFRRFAGPEEPVVKFHLSADNADVLAAVRDADTLSEVAGK